MNNSITIKGAKFIREYGEGVVQRDNVDILSIKPYDAFSFDIYHNDNSLFASCRPSSKFRCFLILNDLFLGDFHFANKEKEIIRIHFKGLFGLKRLLIHKEEEFPFPRNWKDIKFHDSISTFKHRWHGSLISTTSNENYTNELICVSSYLWYRHDRIRAF